MKKKVTCFQVTETALLMEEQIVKKLDIKKASFHRRMIDAFLASEQKIEPRLLITEHTNPNRIIKTKREQIYLDEERERKLLEVIERHPEVKKAGKKNGLSIILFQAMIYYLSCIYPIVMSED